MTDKDYHKIIELSNVGGGFIPVNSNAEELLEQSHRDEVLSFLEITNRDLQLHRCYFSLLGYIYDYLPQAFKKKVEKDKFYLFIKHLKKQYKVLYTFADGSQQIEYDSISFGRMSNMRFKEYVKEQLPFIYSDIIGVFFEGEIYNGIIETIETEYEKFFTKL
jgi:ribosomal protein RSM22 (predicted rRNA methylase)